MFPVPFIELRRWQYRSEDKMLISSKCAFHIKKHEEDNLVFSVKGHNLKYMWEIVFHRSIEFLNVYQKRLLIKKKSLHGAIRDDSLSWQLQSQSLQSSFSCSLYYSSGLSATLWFFLTFSISFLFLPSSVSLHFFFYLRLLKSPLLSAKRSCCRWPWNYSWAEGLHLCCSRAAKSILHLDPASFSQPEF